MKFLIVKDSLFLEFFHLKANIFKTRICTLKYTAKKWKILEFPITMLSTSAPIKKQTSQLVPYLKNYYFSIHSTKPFRL